MPYLSIGQILEIAAMLTLGYFMSRFRAKFVLIAGIIANIFRYSILAFTTSKLGALVAIAFHGVAYTFFFSAVFIFLDYQTEKGTRAGVHQLFRIIYLGFGTLFGNLTAGYIKDNFTWQYFWITPAVISGLVFIILLFFPCTKKPAQ
jgi:MFS family permease